MAITGNSNRKNKSKDKDEATENNHDNETESDDMDDIQQNGVFIKNSSKNKVTTKRNSKDSFQLLEGELLSAEENLQNFLLQTLGKSNSSVYDILLQHGRKRRFQTDDQILKKDEKGKGLFIIMDGKVNIMTSDYNDIINTLNAGDIFGDISTVFNIPVTANVVASNDTTLVNLTAEMSLTLFDDVKDLDVIDWFIRRRYLPTSVAIDGARMYRRLALRTIKRLPLFSNWTDKMLKQLIMSFEQNIVTLYPKKSLMVVEQDPLTSVYVILSGKIELKQGSRSIKSIDITSGEPFVYTELALLVDGKVSPVTIKALTNSQVIQLNRENVIRVLENFPDHMDALSETSRLFRISFERMGHVYLKNEADLQIEILCSYLKLSPLYSALSTEQIWKIILNGELQEFDVGSRVVLDVEHEKIESIVVLRGEVEVKPREVSNKEVAVPELMAQSGDEVTKKAAELDDSDIAIVGVEARDSKIERDRNRHTLQVGSLVDMQTVAKDRLSLKASMPCLILKLRKCIQNTNEADALLEVNSGDKVVSEDDLKLV